MAAGTLAAVQRSSTFVREVATMPEMLDIEKRNHYGVCNIIVSPQGLVV